MSERFRNYRAAVAAMVVEHEAGNLQACVVAIDDYWIVRPAEGLARGATVILSRDDVPEGIGLDRLVRQFPPEVSE